MIESNFMSTDVLKSATNYYRKVINCHSERFLITKERNLIMHGSNHQSNKIKTPNSYSKQHFVFLIHVSIIAVNEYEST
jgi:hypothetical protein